MRGSLVTYAMAAAMVVGLGSTAAFSEPCDELVGRLLVKNLKKPIEDADCGPLGKAGLDKPQHKLESVCYSSSGPTSSVAVVATLSCKTSDKALIKSSVAEKVTATMQVSGSDCKVTDIKVAASGEIGKVLAKVFDLDGKARVGLQNALTNACN